MLSFRKVKSGIFSFTIVACAILSGVIDCKAQTQIQYSPSIVSLLTGIDSISGNLNMDMNNGVFYKATKDEELFLKINPNTSCETHVELADGVLIGLAYKFNTPLIFKDAKGLNCSGVYVTGISLGSGKPVNITYSADDSSSKCLATDKRIIRTLKTLFSLTTKLTDAMGGSPLGSGDAAVWSDCTNNFSVLSTKRNIVQRIYVNRTSETGLIVRLKSNWKIYFNDSQDYDNHILTDKTNYLSIVDLNCEVGTPRLLLNVDVLLNSVKECQIQSFGVNLLLPSPKFSNLKMTLANNDGVNKRITISGDLSSTIGAVSQMQIAGQYSTSNLNFDEGSALDVKGLSMEFSGVKNTDIRFGLGTKLSLRLKNSNLSLNKFTNVHIDHGSIDGTSLVAEFNSERSETFWQGALYGVQFIIDGGVIGLNSKSQVNVKAGSLMARHLDLNNSINPQLTGTFDQFLVNFVPDNNFSCSDKGFNFILKDGSYINQTDDDPVHLEKDEDYPLGTLLYHFNYSKFTLNDQNQFNLNDGTFDGKFKNAGREQFAVREVVLVGSLNAQVRDKMISTTFDIRGRLDFSKDIGPDFSGVVTFVLKPLTSPAEITTDCQGDDQLDWAAQCDEHQFPVKIQFNLQNQVRFANVRITIKKGLLQSFYGQTDGVLLIIIPKGYGEYDGNHTGCDEIAGNIHNEDRGDDDIKDKQEVARATVCARRCTWHVWANDVTYPVAFTFNFEYNLSNETLKPTVVLRPKVDLRGLDPQYTTHGCDDLITGEIANLLFNVKGKFKDLIQKQLDAYSDKFSQSITLTP